jgi:hypothetical protein
MLVVIASVTVMDQATTMDDAKRRTTMMNVTVMDQATIMDDDDERGDDDDDDEAKTDDEGCKKPKAKQPKSS